MKHQKGTKNSADVFSRLSIQSKIEKSRRVTDEFVNFVIKTRLQFIDIRHEPKMDDIINLVTKALKGNSWPKNSLSLQPFSKIWQALCVENYKIVLSKTLYKKNSITSTPKPCGN